MNEPAPSEPVQSPQPVEPAAAAHSPDAVRCPRRGESTIFHFAAAALAIGAGIWCIYDVQAGKYPRPDVPFSTSTINEWGGYVFNHGGQYAFPALGLLALVAGIIAIRRVLVADRDGIGYSPAKRVAWGDVTEMDATRLKEKGILDLHHADGKLRLDSYKLQNFKPLVAFVEQQVPQDKRKI